MLSKSAARKFFLVGTGLCTGAFLLLTLDSLKQIPIQTHQENLTPEAIRGKHLWEKNNCMGCHTILGEGAYYAPEMTLVYERRGPEFIKAMLTNPEAMYPGQRKMIKYNFTETERNDLVSFFKWIGKIDLNGFPPKPDLAPQKSTSAVIAMTSHAGPRPQIFSQICTACHSLGGQGGQVGPALDDVGSRRGKEYISTWLKNPQAVKADSKMPKLALTDLDIESLSTYLAQMKGALQ